jgi:hypothetical protein
MKELWKICSCTIIIPDTFPILPADVLNVKAKLLCQYAGCLNKVNYLGLYERSVEENIWTKEG